MPTGPQGVYELSPHSPHYCYVYHHGYNSDGSPYNRGQVPPGGYGYSLLARTKVFVQLYRAKAAWYYLWKKGRYGTFISRRGRVYFGDTPKLKARISALQDLLEKMMEPYYEDFLLPATPIRVPP